MTDQKFVEIIKLLLEKTPVGDIQWESTTAGTRQQIQQFQTSFADYFPLVRGPDEDIDLAITNEEREIIEVFGSICGEASKRC